MKNKTTTYLRRRRSTLLKRLTSIEPGIIRGSLIERYKRCGKKGCKCMQGTGHGPKYYLALSVYGGKPDVIYVPITQVSKVKKHVAHFQRVQETLKEICDINREFLRRREDF